MSGWFPVRSSCCSSSVFSAAPHSRSPPTGRLPGPHFLESVIRASFYPLFNAWLIRRTDEDIRATVLSTTSVSNALGQVSGGPVSGVIGNLYGIPAALLSSAALLFPGAVFFARATRLQRRGTDAASTPGAGSR